MTDLTHEERVSRWTARLRRDGFAVIPDCIGADQVGMLDDDLAAQLQNAPFSRGGFYGERTKRLGGILTRSPHAVAFVRHPLILDIARAILASGCERIALNLTQAIEIHQGALPQIPHRDEAMWPLRASGHEYLVNVIWPLVPFTRDNGATRLWPGSHVDRTADLPDEDAAFHATMPQGSALLFLGSTLHGGGENRTPSPRRAVLVSYCLGWLKPFENQWLVYPPEIARAFDPELAALVGYVQHRPSLGNVEGQCPSRLLRRGDGEIDAPTDALTVEQEAMLGNYVAGQRRAREASS